MSQRRAGAVLALTLTVTAAVTAGAALLGGPADAVSAPPLRPSAWAGWIQDRGPAAAVAFLLRLIVVALGTWVLVTTSTAVVVSLVAGRASRASTRLVVPPLRRLVGAATGAGAVVALLSPGVVGAESTPPRPPVLERVAPEPAPPSEPPMLRRIDPPSDDKSATTSSLPAASPPGDEAGAPAPPPPGAPPSTWTIQPGQHFWAVAEQVLSAAWGRTPTDGETDPYWRRLVSHNLDRLVDPGNPDLLMPGQQIRLPAPPPPPQG